MNVQDAYNNWALQYDTNENKTRDLEAKALREILSTVSFDTCLEIGCGTGKNTEWLIIKAKQILAVDLSDGMLEKAKSKIVSDKVQFQQADIIKSWGFTQQQFDVAVFSLMLEHIEDLQSVFKNLSEKISGNGYVYIGELHPFKQYAGSKARYESEEGVQEVTCFTHHFSEFVGAALQHGFELVQVKEYFDEEVNPLPRILALLFRKK